MTASSRQEDTTPEAAYLARRLRDTAGDAAVVCGLVILLFGSLAFNAFIQLLPKPDG